MKVIFKIFFILFAFNSFAQTDDEVYTIVQKMPEFTGGNKEMTKYFNANLNNVKDHQSFTSIKTFIVATIDTNGKVKDAKVIKSCGNTINDKKCIDVVNKMPAWIPGKQNEKKVAVYMNIIVPIEFTRNQYDAYLEEVQNKEKENKLYSEGVKNASEDKNELALENFKKCLKLNPNNLDALLNIGNIYLKLDQKNNACLSWNKLKTLGKNDADDLIKKHCN